MESEYIVNRNDPFLETWATSNHTFSCIRDMYILTCHDSWNRLKQNSQNPIEEGNANFISILIGIAVCIIIVAALIFYIVKLKKKMTGLEAQLQDEQPLSRIEPENS